MSHICKKKMFCTALQDPAVSFEQGPSNHLETRASCPGICLGLRNCYLGSVHMPWHWSACTEQWPSRICSQGLNDARPSLGKIDLAHAALSLFGGVRKVCIPAAYAAISASTNAAFELRRTVTGRRAIDQTMAVMISLPCRYRHLVSNKSQVVFSYTRCKKGSAFSVIGRW